MRGESVSQSETILKVSSYRSILLPEESRTLYLKFAQRCGK